MKPNPYLRSIATISAIVHMLAAFAIMTAPANPRSALYQVMPPIGWAALVWTVGLVLLGGWIHPPLIRWGYAFAGMFWGAATAGTIANAIISQAPAMWFTALFLAYICALHAALCWPQLYVPDLSVGAE